MSLLTGSLLSSVITPFIPFACQSGVMQGIIFFKYV
jgi:hypothetical protein